MNPPPVSILAIVGPTASGKTALAIELAERLDTEIISADSMQVYKGMEIGTAAPTPEEQARAKHHFISFLDPGEQFSAGAFEREARNAVDALNAQGKVAVVVGGSGLYVRALIDGLFPGPGRDEAIRERLHRQAEEQGVAHLFSQLEQIDPDYAETINDNDLRRIVRALEVYELTGEPLSTLHRKHRNEVSPSASFPSQPETRNPIPDTLPTLQVALSWPRELLYDRINTRVDRILEAGFIDEVVALLRQGHEPHLKRLRSLGYREFIAYLHGECTLEQATEAMKQNTRRFAKRQLTWFRPDKRIHWLPADPDTPPQAYVNAVLDILPH